MAGKSSPKLPDWLIGPTGIGHVVAERIVGLGGETQSILAGQRLERSRVIFQHQVANRLAEIPKKPLRSLRRIDDTPAENRQE